MSMTYERNQNVSLREIDAGHANVREQQYSGIIPRGAAELIHGVLANIPGLETVHLVAKDVKEGENLTRIN